MALPFLASVSGLLEPLRLGEEAPAGHSRENVCQWTTLFEALSPLETCISNKERETSTNYTLNEFQAMHLPFGLAVAPHEGETRFHRLIILLESLPRSSGVLLSRVSLLFRATHPSVRPLAPAAEW